MMLAAMPMMMIAAIVIVASMDREFALFTPVLSRGIASVDRKSAWYISRSKVFKN